MTFAGFGSKAAVLQGARNRRRNAPQEHGPRPSVSERAIASPALVDDFCALAADALPLLKWGWDALADSR
jgi:hypothetical protein